MGAKGGAHTGKIIGMIKLAAFDRNGRGKAKPRQKVGGHVDTQPVTNHTQAQAGGRAGWIDKHI